MPMQRDPPDMRRVERLLVIKTSALGDIAKTIPTVDAIRRAYPGLRIGWVVRQGLHDLLVGNPSVDEILIAPRGVGALWSVGRRMRRFRADVLLDMQGLFLSGCLARLSGAPWRCTWQSGRELSGLLTGNPIVPAPADRNATECLFGFGRVLGVTEFPCEPPAYLARAPELSARADHLLGAAPRPLVGMHVGASTPNKTWPAHHFAELARRLIGDGFGVALFGGSSEAAAGEAVAAAAPGCVSLVRRTGLRELAACLARCSLFVGGDTGATHIAALVGTPTVCLMGATDPVRTGPYGDAHTVLDLRLPCSPCYRRPTCGGRFDCMADLSPEIVHSACLRSLSAHLAVG